MKLRCLFALLLFLWITGNSVRAADPPPLRFGLVTDVHYADKPGKKRPYRNSITKLTEAVATFNASNAVFAVELGDFIDNGKTLDDDIGHARTIETVFAKFGGARHHVVGNHDVTALTKPEFLKACGATNTNSFYSFDTGGYHFVILDACFRPDGVPHGAHQAAWTDAFITQHELDWLAADLKAAAKPTICFVHQRLDTIENTSGTANAPKVRAILERSRNVLAVFHGHAHINIYNLINGIHYVTLAGMIETEGAYALVEAQPDDTLVVTGFRGQKSMRLEHRAAGQLTQQPSAGMLTAQLSQ